DRIGHPLRRDWRAERREGLTRLGAMTTRVEDLERELKFVLPAGRAAAARAFLSTLCAPDTEYPRALVWTVYYDTADAKSLGEKIDSDYLKMKLRVRWYGGADDRPAGAAFVEAKYRMGARREKVRVKLEVDGAALAG